jgi:hypothetical protein
MTEPKKFVRAEPMSKDRLREMLAQAVRNTAPELNPVAAPTPAPASQPKPRDRAPVRAAPKPAAKKKPAKALPKGRKKRA